MNLYKGYIETKNKMPLKGETLKGRESFPTIEEIRSFNVEEFSGVLNNDVVLLDFDDEEQAGKALQIVSDEGLKCRAIKTPRGVHLLFKANNKVNKSSTCAQLACGLVCGVKLGDKNGIECLKQNGQERKVLFDTSNNGYYDELPVYFVPNGIHKEKHIDFKSVEGSIGRQGEIHRYMLILINNMSKEDVKKSVQILNKYVFDTPMNSKEMQSLTSDDTFNRPEIMFFDEGTFLFDEFAKYLVSAAKIIKIDNNLHIYKDGIYINGSDYIEREMIKYIPRLSRSRRKEVMDYIDLLVDKNECEADYTHLLAFRNGIYNLSTKELLPFSEDYIITNKINWDYVPGAYSEVADKTLNKLVCNRPNLRLLLEEMIGYAFYRNNELGKAFMLVGDKANGKSTFQGMLRYLLGNNNVSSLDLCELTEKFKNAELFGKMANIGDDIGEEFITNSSFFKKLVTGEEITVERKGEKPFDFGCHAKFYFSANVPPRMCDKTGAVKRRMILFPFENTFSKDDPDFDPYIKYKLREPEVMSYLINIGIEGLDRILTNRGFTECKEVKEKVEEYDRENNPIKIFFEDLDFEEDIENEPTINVYNRYRDFAIENNLHPMSNIEFSKMLNANFGTATKTVRMDGKTVRVFVKR